MRAIVEHGVQSVRNPLQQIVAHDDQRDAARSHVLLRAGIDECILINRNWMRQNVGRSIGNQRNVANFGSCFHSTPSIVSFVVM